MPCHQTRYFFFFCVCVFGGWGAWYYLPYIPWNKGMLNAIEHPYIETGSSWDMAVIATKPGYHPSSLTTHYGFVENGSH